MYRLAQDTLPVVPLYLHIETVPVLGPPAPITSIVLNLKGSGLELTPPMLPKSRMSQESSLWNWSTVSFMI